MSNIASKSLRQASRLYPKSPAGLIRSPSLAESRVAAIASSKISSRNYVSETKKDNASVNVDTAIRAEQKAFFQQTGKKPEAQPMMGTSVNADAMMSPIAGVC